MVSKRLPILLEFSLFSAQILGFSADFHRKSLAIVKQHPNNARIWDDFVLAKLYQGPTLVNISLTVRSDKKFGVGKWKKKNIRILTFQ